MTVIDKSPHDTYQPNNKATYGRVHLADGVGDGAGLRQFRKTLTAAQIKALHSTPITLIAAPAAGHYTSVVEVTAILNYGTTAFTGNNNIEIRYTDGSGAKATGDLAYAWLLGTATAPVKAVGAAVTPVGAAAIVAVVPTANPAAGDSTVTIEGFYRDVILP